MEGSTKLIIEALTPLANKIGQGAEELFKIYTRQAFIEGTTELIWGVALLALALVAFMVARKFYREGDDDDKGAVVFIGGLLLALLLGLSAGNLTTGIQKTLNPKYYAIQRIVEQVKK